MAIEFVVEDGTGKIDSTSYAEIADFKQYFENKGTTFTETDDIIKTWLNEATEYADTIYNWGGEKYSETQALQVPRSYWYCNGADLSESVPVALQKGIYELAYSRQGASSVNTGKQFDGNIKSESLSGVGSVTYGSTSNNNGLPEYPNADRWFNQLCLNEGFGRVCRV